MDEMVQVAPESAPTHEVVTRSEWVMAWYGLVVLIVATVLAATDRQVMVLLAEPIRHSLGLTDTKLGLLQGAGIALFAGAAAVPIGWLADRYDRRSVLAGCVVIWSAATAACGMAWDFPSLFAAAIGLGIGEAGLAPIVYGLIPALVPPKRRALANGIYALAAIFGAGLGIALSGTMIHAIQSARTSLPAGMQHLEGWRLSFFAVAVPGPIVALLIALIRLRKAPVKAHETLQQEPPRLASYLRDHGFTLFGVFGGVGMGGLGIAALGAWAPVVATRNFGASAPDVGQGIGAAYLIGTAIGAVVGGYGYKRLRPIVGVATPLRVLAIGLGLSAFAAAAMFWVTSALQIYVLFGLQVVFLIAGSVVAPTLLQDMTPALLRSRIIALGSVITLLLTALSPVLVGLLSDMLQGNSRGLLIATSVIAAVSMVLGAVLTLKIEPRFVRTVSAVAEQAELDSQPLSDWPPGTTPDATHTPSGDHHV